jgi:phosphoglycolate phosphatase
VNAKRKIEAVVFDFDGTLTKLNIEFHLMRKAILDLIGTYGIPINGLANMYALETIKAAFGLILERNPGKEEEFLEQALGLVKAIEVEAAKKGELISGTKDMLLELKKRNIKIAVVTRNCRAAVTTVFPDIEDYCQTVITRETTPNVKPHPDQLLIALRSLGVKPDSSAMVGDHPMDIKIGKDAGALTVGVLTGYSTSDELSKAGADFILSKAADIINSLP